MKARQLYRAAEKVLHADLASHGFIMRNGDYLKILGSGVVQQIGFGKDPHGADTFRVMTGVGAVCLRENCDEPFGYIKGDGLYHLTPRGWHNNSGRWPCDTEEEARKSMELLRPLILELALPWLDSHTTLSSVAAEISDVREPGLGWMKARLYMLDGDSERATEAIENYAAWAAKPRNWGTREFQMEDMERAERIRQEIEKARGK